MSDDVHPPGWETGTSLSATVTSLSPGPATAGEASSHPPRGLKSRRFVSGTGFRRVSTRGDRPDGSLWGSPQTSPVPPRSLPVPDSPDAPVGGGSLGVKARSRVSPSSRRLASDPSATVALLRLRRLPGRTAAVGREATPQPGRSDVGINVHRTLGRSCVRDSAKGSKFKKGL